MTNELLITILGFATALVTGFIMIWREVRTVHRTVNSRMDELLELTRLTAHKAGVEEGKDRQSSGSE